MGWAGVLKNETSREHSRAMVIMVLRAIALASKFVLTLFVAKYLGVEAIGHYGYVAGAAAILPVAFGFGFMQELSRTLVISGISSIIAPLSAYWIFVTLAYVCVTACVTAAVYGFVAAVPSATVMLVGGVLLLEHLNNDAFFIISNLKRPIFANFQVFLRAALWILVYMPAAWAFPSLRTIDALLAFWLVGITGSWALFLTSCLRPACRIASQTSIPTTGMIRRVWLLKTIYAGELVNALGVYLDRYLIGGLLGAKAAGIYVLFASIGLGIYNLVNTSIMQVFRPYLIEHHSKQDDALFARAHGECMKKSLLSAVILSLGCATAFHFCEPYLGQPELAGHETILWILLVGGVLRVASDVQGYVFYTRRQDRLFLRTAIVAVIASTCLLMALVPMFGLYGGVLAFLGAYTTAFLVRTYLIRTMREFRQ